MNENEIKLFGLKDIIKSFPIILLMYIYVFQPPVVRKEIYIGLEFLLFLGYITFSPSSFFSFIRKFKVELIFLFTIVLVSVLRDLFTGEIVYFDRFLAWSFQSFLFGYFVFKLLETKKIENKIIPLLHVCAVIASVITLILLLNKPLDDYYKLFVKDGSDEYLQDSSFRYRAYGISENLTFTYSYLLGLFAGLTLLVLNRNYLLSIVIILLLLGVSFNARVGFLPFMLFLLISFFKRKAGNILAFILLSTLIIVSVFMYFGDYSEVFLHNEEWILSFLYDISDSLLGTNFNQENSTVNTLLGDFVILPSNFSEWIVGTGVSLFGRTTKSSDNGFILQLYYGGLFIFIPIIFFIAYSAYRLQRTIGINHWFFIIYLFSILVLNTKGFLFAATPGGRVLFFLYVYAILYGSKKQVLNPLTSKLNHAK